MAYYKNHYLGYIVQNAVVSLPYGGFKIADVLRSKLSDQNPGVYTFMSPVERYILRYIMEQVCVELLLSHVQYSTVIYCIGHFNIEGLLRC